MNNTPNRRATDLEQDYQTQIRKDIRTTRRMFYICFTVIFSAILAMVVWAYWKSAPYDPIHLTQYKADVVPDPIVGDGEQSVTVSFNYCKNYNGRAKVTRTLIGSRISVDLPLDSQVPLETGCHRAERKALIPKINNVGMYHIHYKVEYPCNPIRTCVYEYDTYDFEITKPQTLDALP